MNGDECHPERVHPRFCPSGPVRGAILIPVVSHLDSLGDVAIFHG
jgi:hypothetical protein